MKKYLYGTLAALVAVLFLLVGSAGFTAANASVKANEFCKKSDVGKVVVDGGKTWRCEKDGEHNRWKPYTPPVVSSSSKSASTSASATASASTSASATSSTSASSSTSTTPPPNSASSTQLPLTGVPVPLVLLIGALVIAAGGGLFYAARRRTRFTA